MLNKLLNLFKKAYQTLNLLEISRANLLHNYRYLSSLSSLKVAPVLKSNAYGHGIQEVGKILDSQRSPFFCVDSLYEAYELYKAKVKTPILIMGYTNPENLKVKKLPFSYTVYDLETLQVLDKYQKGAKIHIKVDTGMHRLGVTLEELPKFFNQLKQFPHLQVEGVMSHLASAQNSKDRLFLSQVENFQHACQIVKEAGFSPQWLHLGASESLVNPKSRKILAKVSNLIRSGLALYGIPVETPDPHLKPILEFKTKLVQIKELHRGEKVGYDGTFQAVKKMIVGILPLGYFDGIDRRLSNKGTVSLNGVQCPIIGRVSMNITTVDVSLVQNPQVGEEVVVYSRSPKKPNSIQNCARVCQTIPYDLLVHLASTTRRVIN